jgi:hypothetical protein
VISKPAVVLATSIACVCVGWRVAAHSAVSAVIAPALPAAVLHACYHYVLLLIIIIIIIVMLAILAKS